jgi:hypothetical protein
MEPRGGRRVCLYHRLEKTLSVKREPRVKNQGKGETRKTSKVLKKKGGGKRRKKEMDGRWKRGEKRLMKIKA